MKPIATQWQTYVDSVMPKDAPPIQVVETRRAFYAGALAFYSIMMNGLADTEADEVLQSDIDLMTTIANELKDFGKSIPKG